MKRSLSFTAVLAFAATAELAFSQGPLNPPGAPAPTMKSLDELDTRIGETSTKIDAASAKVDQVDAKTEKRLPISSLPFTINTPGSYYLTKNLTATAAQPGITVSVSNVTIDLNGFRLAGGTTGIFLDFGASGCTIRNGTIQGWANSGISALNATEVLVEHIHVADNAVAGIRVGQNSIVRSCTSRNNGSATSGIGISAGRGSVISKCTVTETNGTGSSPLRGDSTTLIVDCVARGNSAGGSNVIEVGTGGSIVRCIATNNGGTAAGIATGNNAKVIDCTSSTNTGLDNDGIVVGAGSEVRNCTANSNFGVGIRASDQCVLVGNHCVSNSVGLQVTGDGNRIEANHLKGSSTALIVAGTGNLIIKNSASGQAGNSGEYAVVANNAVGPFVTRNNVASNTNPNANFDLDTP